MMAAGKQSSSHFLCPDRRHIGKYRRVQKDCRTLSSVAS